MKSKSLAIVAFSSLILSGCDRIKQSIESVKSGSEGEPAAEATIPISSGVVQELTGDQISSFVATPGKVVVLDFHAAWCGPCKSLGPKLERVAGEFGGQVVVGKIDVDQANEAAGRMGVSSIPDVRIYRDGKEIDRFVGDGPEDEIRGKLKAATSGMPTSVAASAEGEPAAVAQPIIQPMQKDWMPEGMQRR